MLSPSKPSAPSSHPMQEAALLIFLAERAGVQRSTETFLEEGYVPLSPGFPHKDALCALHMRTFVLANRFSVPFLILKRRRCSADAAERSVGVASISGQTLAQPVRPATRASTRVAARCKKPAHAHSEEEAPPSAAPDPRGRVTKAGKGPRAKPGHGAVPEANAEGDSSQPVEQRVVGLLLRAVWLARSAPLLLRKALDLLVVASEQQGCLHCALMFLTAGLGCNLRLQYAAAVDAKLHAANVRHAAGSGDGKGADQVGCPEAWMSLAFWVPLTVI